MPPVKTQLLDELYYLGGVYVEIDQAYKHADFTKDLQAFIPVLKKQEQEMFSGQNDSAGEARAPLAESTIAKKGHDRILFETGALGDSLFSETDDSIRDVSDHYLTFGTSDKKAMFHQEGTRRMPARPPVGISPENIDKFSDSMADALVEKLKD